MAGDAETTAMNFQKCGEVTIAVDFDEKIYALNCIFCGAVCLQLDAFAVHIEDQHAKQLLTIKQMTTDQEEEMLEEKVVPELIDLQKTSKVYDDFRVQEKTSKVVTHFSCDDPDPLGEPLSVMSVELPSVFNAKEESGCVFKEKMGCVVAAVKEEMIKEEDEYEEEAEQVEGYTASCSDANKTDTSDSESQSESEEQADDQELDTDDKDLTLAIIAGYEKQRLLWDASEPLAKNRKKCEEALRKIANAINKQMKTHIMPNAIKLHIRKMRYKFRTELQNQQQAISKGESYTPLWYYNKLAFLNTSIKYKRRSKRGVQALASEKSALPLPNLTDAQNHELIEIYKSFPCLWDVQHIGFRFKNQRQDAMEEMLQDIKSKMNLDLNQDNLQRKLYRIRYACTQEKHRKLKCERQGETYKPTCKYYEGISFLEDNVGPFKCTICDQTFNGADQYKIHKSEHDGSMPFTCPVCNRGFMKVGNCTVHLRRHTRDFHFECKVCGKRYATSTDLTVHMRYHTGDKPYFCEVCGQWFRTWTFFDAHLRRHQKRPSHKCTICSKAFYENNKLKQHMKAHLNIRDKVCNVCGKAFTNSKYLRQHQEIHAEKRKYVCKICTKDFAQYAGLSGHMKKHGTKLSGILYEYEKLH